jgi:hypothetical protein
MKITRDNYEQFMADYLEGLLDPGKAREMEAFLDAHPDILDELDSYEQVKMKPDSNIFFPGREKLMRSIRAAGPVCEENIDDYLVAEAEGILDDEGAQLLNRFMALNPVFERDRKLYALARLTPEAGLVYPDKTALKRPATVIMRGSISRHIAVILAAAAAILVLYLVVGPIPGKDERSLQQPSAQQALPSSSDHLKNHEARPGLQNDLSRGLVQLTKEESSIEIIAGDAAAANHVRLAPVTMKPLRTDALALYEEKPGEVPRRERLSATPDIPEEKMTLGKATSLVLRNMTQKSRDIVAVSQDKNKFDEKSGAWKFLTLGVKGYGLISDKDLDLALQHDPLGKVVEYSVVDNGQVIFKRSTAKR